MTNTSETLNRCRSEFDTWHRGKFGYVLLTDDDPRWASWQEAWNRQQAEIEGAKDTIMALNDGLGALANE